jgi:hypothetical protein
MNRAVQRSVVAAACLAAALVVGVTVVQAHGGDPKLIHACVDNSTGAVTIIADPTPFGSPRRTCPRPTVQHALDWNQQGIQGPPGPPGSDGSAGLRVYEYERSKSLHIGWNQDKQVVALAVPAGGAYAVSAKLTASGNTELSVKCSLSTLPPGPDGDASTAHLGLFSKNDGLDNPVQTVYLQEVYRIPPEASIKIIRVRCKTTQGAADLSDVSIEAIRLPYAPK